MKDTVILAGLLVLLLAIVLAVLFVNGLITP